MTGARFLPHQLAASVLLTAMMQARHQAWQEALGPAGKAFTMATSPARLQALATGNPHCSLQELISAMIQRNGELQVHAVEHHGVGVGFWERA